LIPPTRGIVGTVDFCEYYVYPACTHVLAREGKRMMSLLAELRQRKLVQWALAYVAAAFAFKGGLSDQGVD